MILSVEKLFSIINSSMCCYIITDNEFSRYSKSVATESENWADEGIGIKGAMVIKKKYYKNMNNILLCFFCWTVWLSGVMCKPCMTLSSSKYRLAMTYVKNQGKH